MMKELEIPAETQPDWILYAMPRYLMSVNLFIDSQLIRHMKAHRADQEGEVNIMQTHFL